MCRGEMHSSCWNRIVSGLLLIPCLGWSPALAAADPTKDIHIQVMLGATRYDDLAFESRSATDPSLEAESEISLMPTLGICGGLPLMKDAVTLGLEGGVIFGWRNDDVTAVGRDGNIRVYIDNKLYLLDLFLGPYMSVDPGKHTRIYAAAGPLLMVGQYDKSSNEEVSGGETLRDDETSMTSGAGMYARTGIEYRFEDGSMIGLCVRGFRSRLDFENLPEKVDVKGIQLLITFSPTP